MAKLPKEITDEIYQSGYEQGRADQKKEDNEFREMTKQLKEKKMNKLYEMFHPEIKLMDKRLSGNSPCVDCENIHRFTRGTAWEETQIDPNRCDSCMNKLLYNMDCMDKLRWYEDNDSRVNILEQKDTNKYDCGVKCPGTLSNDGYPILYPDGWAKEENEDPEFNGEQLIAEYNAELLDKVAEKLKAKYPPYGVNNTLHKDIDEVIAEVKKITNLEKPFGIDFKGIDEIAEQLKERCLEDKIKEHDAKLLDKVAEKLKAKYSPYFNEFGMSVNDTLHKDIDEVIAEMKAEVK